MRYRPADPDSPWQQLWLQLHRRGIWRPLLDEPLVVGDYRWTGRADEGHPPDDCSLDPIVQELIERHDADGIPVSRVLVGMFRVADCSSPLPPLNFDPANPTPGQTPVVVRPTASRTPSAPAPP